MKDLKIKIKTHEPDSSFSDESFKAIQNEYNRAISGTQFVEDALTKEQAINKKSLDTLSKKFKKGYSFKKSGKKFYE